MRKILFRGKVKNGFDACKEKSDGGWVEGYYYKQVVLDVVDGEMQDREAHFIKEFTHEDYDYEHSYEVDPATVGQYTGLQDSKRNEEFPNGQRIFEGDIVEYRDFMNEHFLRRREVIYCSRYLGFVVKGSNQFPSSRQKPVVVGNIYDNPEFLEVVQ